MKHSNIVGSSTAARRLNCPGSIDLEAQMPNRESRFAAEGTACHTAMEYLLGRDKSPIEVEGMTFYNHEMTPERVDWLAECVKVFDKVVGVREFELERTLPFPGIEDAFGTGDVLWFDDDEIGVIDWKFGQGVPVSAKGNSQLKFLLCAARATLPKPVSRYHGCIVQPRRDYVGTDVFSNLDLDAFEAELKHAVTHGRHSNDPYSIGTWCRFCTGMMICPKQRTRLEEIAALRDISGEVASILDARDDIQQTLKDAEKYAQKCLEEGLPVPGYKLVRKTGNRAWKDERKAERYLANHGVAAKDRRKVGLLSPNQIEKLRPDLKDGIARHWENPDRGVGVAEESDKRPAILTGQGLDSALAEALDKYMKD